MPTHVALLRGINLAGKHKVAMADLREIVAALGHDDVATYVQSGNVVFTAGRDATGSELADELGRALAERLDFAPAVVVRTRDELAEAIAANPFPGEENPKHVHAVFTDGDPGEDVSDGRDEARVVGGTLYLHTPDGLGRSKLAAKLTRTRDGTARNWSTVTRLLAMLDG